ncbi:N-acetylmuramoyl-L-alanine amidase [Rossellomorea aquimaris]|uniref:N-acetylmuramoyl-L-alanine amidase family protein n=1 Tax=Rossellomorea aquimaris TaxID=189382 RepID=UPI001CD5D458|nr:N-acetylmuramoyl-L-alanine amidase [Rossellomorea aquimaris]MCA1058128.1 N-acetylmuramoyl-L-alanine amidase [Rossellomorea aquimaris]
MPTVILDPGHGTDTYENGGGKGVKVGGKVYEEHDFNSDVALRIEKILKTHGVKVVFSQNPYSKDVSLTSRTNLAKRIIPNMFISIHANAGASSVEGICVFAWENATNSNRMADLVVKHMKADGIKTHGNGRHYSMLNSWTNLHITRELAKVNLPGVLIEHGFMTSKSDFENIFGKYSNSYRQKCAVADSKAILEYLGIKYKGEATTQQKPKEEKEVENAIIINSVNDYPAAELLAEKLGCSIYPSKNAYKKSQNKVKHIYVVGGNKDGVQADKVTLLAGPDRLTTYGEVKKAL